jgi:thiol-disulfide isomerase/thioredoxin
MMKQFNLLIIYIATIGLFVSCESTNPINPKKTLVTGKISNFDKFSQKNWIEVLPPDLFSLEFPFKQIKVDSLGCFRYEIELVSPALCWGIYNKWFPFVISPGDSLHLSIDANIWADSTRGAISKGEYIQISGTVKEDYNKIIDFQEWASDSLYTRSSSRSINKSVRTKSANEFKQLVKNREEEVIKQIETWGRKQNAGKLFYDVLKSEIKYRCLEDVTRYYWQNPFENGIGFEDIKLTQNYFSFLTECEMDNHNFFVGRRVEFIKALQFSLSLSNIKERKTLLDIRKNKGKAEISNGYFTNQATYLSRYTKGISRDLCLYNFALSNLKIVPAKSQEIYDAVSVLIEEPYVKEQFAKEFKTILVETKPINKLIRSHETTALDSLIRQYPGKVIYVDFWAPWCAPCMGEMPHSKRLKENLKGDNIVFVYLACKCSENSWKSTITNKEIDGVNLLLSNEDYTILTKRYRISGIPHFLLINKKGEIVNDNAPRPSNEKSKTAIVELLKEKAL